MQDQQFTLILQTLQQLRDIYGDSVDKIVQGNIENIIFLKSTDDSMIETLVKMSGITHETRTDQKTITRNNERLFNQNEGSISYMSSTKERPVIQFNDFMFIAERNSIVLKAGSSPLWNRRETAYPMSYRLFMDTINIPGRKFGLQTIPTNSSAKDFDVRKNQPDFFKMLEERVIQAKMSDDVKVSFMDAYGLSESDYIQLDQNVVADDIMHAINSRLFNIEHRKSEDIVTEEEMSSGFDEFGVPHDGQTFVEKSKDNIELLAERAVAKRLDDEHVKKRYAGGYISRKDLVSISGQVNSQLDFILAHAYNESKQHFNDGPCFRVNPGTKELMSSDGVIYTRSSDGANREDFQNLEDVSSEDGSRVFGDVDGGPVVLFEVTPAFIKYLASLDSWDSIASGHFELEVKKAYERFKV